MSNKLNDELLGLHHHVAELKVYESDTVGKLYICSKEFATVLDELLSLDAENFTPIAQKYFDETENACRLACEGLSEDDRIANFYNGVIGLNSGINSSLEYFADSE